MPFAAGFANPFHDPSTVPLRYRQHAALQKLFKADGSYVRPAEDPVTMWAIDLLAREYAVPLDAMELELYADFSEGTHQGGRPCLQRKLRSFCRSMSVRFHVPRSGVCNSNRQLQRRLIR